MFTFIVMKPSSRTPAHPRHPVALATFLVFGLAQAATAADDALLAAAPAGQHTLQAVTVTATMTEQEARTAPASVTVVTEEELAQRNAANLLDAVRGTPGVTFQGRQVGGRKTLALRGMEGKHTLTLIDGRRISASDDVIGHSDYQYGWLPMAAVERVEIIRGPLSALYGSEALGGVINLITKKPKDRWMASIGLSGATGLDSDTAADALRTSVYAAGPLGEQFNLAINAEKSYQGSTVLPEDRAQSEIEGNRTRSLGLTASWQPVAGHEVEFGVQDGLEKRDSDDINRTPTYYHNRYELDRTQKHASWNADWGNGWRSQLRAYRSDISIRNLRNNGVAATRPQDMRDSVVDGHASTRWGSHQITVGGEWRKEELVNAGLKNGQDEATHKALFVQDEFALGQNLMATLGLRGDHHEIFGSEVSPRAYLVWEASPTLVVKGGYGHAFKAPTLKQISPNYVGAEGPHSFLGNGNIQPETSNAFELGANWQAAPQLALRATVFHTEVKQLITYRLLQKIGPRSIYQYDNVDAARIQGLEAGFTWDITPRLQWNNDATWLHTRDKTTGQELNDRPRVAWNSTLVWQVQQWRTQLGAETTGKQQSASGKLPAYTLWNASVGRAWKLGGERQLHLSTGIQNLGNVRMQEESPNFGWAEQGRRFFVNARMDF